MWKLDYLIPGVNENTDRLDVEYFETEEAAEEAAERYERENGWITIGVTRMEDDQ